MERKSNFWFVNNIHYLFYSSYERNFVTERLPNVNLNPRFLGFFLQSEHRHAAYQWRDNFLFYSIVIFWNHCFQLRSFSLNYRERLNHCVFGKLILILILIGYVALNTNSGLNATGRECARLLVTQAYSFLELFNCCWCYTVFFHQVDW